MVSFVDIGGALVQRGPAGVFKEQQGGEYG